MGDLGRDVRRVLGIDLGERRIGVALGDLEFGTAAPLVTLSRARTIQADARVLARLASEQRAQALVVGLPLDKDGTEGPQAKLTREWATAVASATGMPLRFRDERLSSVRAEERIGSPPRGRSGGPPSASQRDAHRARIDREAAALILQDDLDARQAEAANRMHQHESVSRSEKPDDLA
ncbi:MAG TPA: Holliday junction resolvase RuvX [Candidatus Limnocylindrales bacterium]